MALSGPISTLVGLALGKAADAFVELRKAGREDKVAIDDSEARRCLMEQVAALAAWADTISLLALTSDKKLSQSFIELSLNLGVARSSKHAAVARPVRLKDAFSGTDHLAILGRPGAGKTTSLQKLAQIAIDSWQRGTGGVPVLVRLREIRDDDSLTTHLLSLLGINVTAGTRVREKTREQWEKRTIQRYLDSISAVLLLDGLDELTHRSRETVETEIRDLVLSEGSYRIVVTCRTADYNRPFQRVQAFTLLPLTQSQVRAFARKWLGSKRATSFLRALAANPYAGSEVVPLTLAHLCAIYARDGELPPRPIEVYENIVSLLVEEWDKQRGVKRLSRYSDFSWRKKERFLQGVAFALTMRGLRGAFRHADLENVYPGLAAEFALPSDACAAVLQEIESHTGLLQLTGHQQYDWVHLSIQEYLTAMYASRLPQGLRHLVPNYPSETALLLANSANANDGLEEVLAVLLSNAPPNRRESFIISLLARLAIERPVFRPDVRFGWVVLALIDSVTRPAATGSLLSALVDDSLRLLNSPPIAHSLEMAIGEAESFRESAAVRVIPGNKGSLPPFLTAELSKGTHGAGLLVPRAILSAALSQDRS